MWEGVGGLVKRGAEARERILRGGYKRRQKKRNAHRGKDKTRGGEPRKKQNAKEESRELAEKKSSLGKVDSESARGNRGGLVVQRRGEKRRLRKGVLSSLEGGEEAR